MPSGYATVMDLGVLLTEGTSAERARAADAYADAVAHVADAQLSACGQLRFAKEAVERDFADMTALDPTHAAAYDRVRYDILTRLDDVAGPSAADEARRTRLVGLAGVAAVLVLVAVYAAVRVYSAVPVTHDIRTVAGVRERADALAKMARYDSLASGRGGLAGIVRNVVLWPIKPTQAEAQGGSQLALLIFSAASETRAMRIACPPAPPTGAFTQEHVALLETIADRLRAPDLRYNAVPLLTIIDAMRTTYPC